KEEVERVRPENVWRYAKKKMGGDGGEKKKTPPLARPDGTYAVTTAEKRALLQPILLPVQSSLSPLAVPFVPTPPPPPPELDWPDLQDDDLTSALTSTRPLAAAGPDDVPNLVLQSLWPVLRTRLVPLFAACLRLGYTPAAWRDATYETRDHYLDACPAYNNLCTRLTRQIGARRLPRPSILLTTATFVRPLLRFLFDTGRFPTLHQVVEDVEDAGADARPRRTAQERATQVREEESRLGAGEAGRDRRGQGRMPRGEE
ncbi:hypothetical protein JCM10207_003299, partial [Rhodosporidiobolus poonsookiae]